MEATALSVGKSVVSGALGYAKSAVAEEVALQLGVQRDQAFVRDELEMMQAFLMAAHGAERDDGKHRVLMAWVKQVRDVAYDAEDSLQDFSVHLNLRSPWRRLRARRRVARRMKDLRARVEDVSQRNLRYQLVRTAAAAASPSAARHPPTAAAAAGDLSSSSSSATAAAVFGVDEARRAAKRDERPRQDLADLVTVESGDLGVIAVWGTGGDLGQTSIINAAYENPGIKSRFPCRAWVRVTRPFDPDAFVQSLVKQFRPAAGVGVLLGREKTGPELAAEFAGYVNEKSYLIVLNDLNAFEEWNVIKTCFPNNKKGSRIIVGTPQVEVASLCAGQESQVLELKQLSAGQTIYAFCDKDYQDQTKLPMPNASTSNDSMVPTDEILGNGSNGDGEKKVITKRLTRIRTIASVLEESQIIGREKERLDIIKLMSDISTQEFPVISVWGMGGIGKTTLVKYVYQSQKIIDMFEKTVCVMVMRPFNLKELLKSLILQLLDVAIDFGGHIRKELTVMGVEALMKELARLLQGKRCLIVLDDLSSTAEWDLIKQSFPKMENTSRIIVTTREEKIAKHCSVKRENVYKLKILEDKNALDLFTRKVFKEAINLDKHPELNEQAKLILKKCSGLPLAIVTMGGFLANQPKTAMEWRKLNEHISAELEMNPELRSIRTVLQKSYDGLPYHLKSCFLYMSIFPEDQKVSRRRLIWRWAAEGYSREFRDKSSEEIADGYFVELIERSMILPSRESIHSRKEIDCCQVHDLMREIAVSNSEEENLVFSLDEGCSSNPRGMVRHLAIGRDWEGDKDEFESLVDLSHVRSLTVFGRWRPFFISDKMRFVRVLDLEGTLGLLDHHLEHIGKLLHLRYLSVRGCNDIVRLPDSLGNLSQLEALDVAFTSIFKLPKAITKLRKLKYLRAASVEKDDDDGFESVVQGIPYLLRNKLCILTGSLLGLCVGCCSPKLLNEHTETTVGDLNRRDVWNFFCCAMIPIMMSNQGPTVVPRGIRKLKALHTLGMVNVAWDKAILQDIGRLTRLRKLAVTGIGKQNGQEMCSVIANLGCLESLLVQSRGDAGLQGCLDAMPSPPKNLQSLKLYGNLVRLPEWISGLHNLVKLTLRSSRISEPGATIEALGKLPNLASLRLWAKSFQGEELRLSFCPEAFPSLTVLSLINIDGLKSVELEEGAMLMLQMLWFQGSCEEADAGLFSGLSFLPNLKEFMLHIKTYKDSFMEDVRGQLNKNQNGPVLKRWQ